MIEGAIAIALVLVAIALHAYRRGHLKVASPVSLMLFWCAILFVWRPLYVGVADKWMLVDYCVGGRPSAGLLFLAFVGAALGMVAYYAGYALPARGWVPRRRLPRIPVRDGQVVAVAVLFLLWGGFSFVRYKPLPFETGLYDENFYIEDGKFVATSSYIASAWICITTVIYMLAASLRRRLPSVLLLVVYSAAIFYGGWSRSVAVVTAIGVAMVEDLRRQRRFVMIALLLLVPIVVPVFNRLSVDREHLQKAWKGDSSSLEAAEDLPGEFSDLDVFVGVVAHVPERLGYSYGMELINRFFTNAIPRAIWPEKRWLLMPEDRYGVRDRLFTGGRVATLFGHLYLEGGVVAIVLVLALTGLVARYSYELVRRHADNAYIVVLYVLFHLHFLASWRDLFQPQYLFLTGQPLAVAMLVGHLLARRRKVSARGPRRSGPEPSQMSGRAPR